MGRGLLRHAGPGTHTRTSFYSTWTVTWGFSGDSGGEASTCQCRRCQRLRFDPWVGKIPLKKERATHSSVLAWKIPGAEEPGRLQSTGSQRVRHNWAIKQQKCHVGAQCEQTLGCSKDTTEQKCLARPRVLARCLSVQHPAKRIQGKSSPVWPWVTLTVQLNLRRNPSGCDEWGLAKAPLSFPNTGCRTEWQSKSPLAWPLRTWD